MSHAKAIAGDDYRPPRSVPRTWRRRDRCERTGPDPRSVQQRDLRDVAHSAVVGGKALQLTNNDGTNASSTALGLNVASGHAPFTVSSKQKVVNLNSDWLDGLDSSSFLPKTGTAVDSSKLGGQLPSYYLPKTGKAVDSDKLDGLDSTSGSGGFTAQQNGGSEVGVTLDASSEANMTANAEYVIAKVAPYSYSDAAFASVTGTAASSTGTEVFFQIVLAQNALGQTGCTFGGAFAAL